MYGQLRTYCYIMYGQLHTYCYMIQLFIVFYLTGRLVFGAGVCSGPFKLVIFC